MSTICLSAAQGISTSAGLAVVIISCNRVAETPFRSPFHQSGGVAERTNAAVLKTLPRRGRGSVAIPPTEPNLALRAALRDVRCPRAEPLTTARDRSVGQSIVPQLSRNPISLAMAVERAEQPTRKVELLGWLERTTYIARSGIAPDSRSRARCCRHHRSPLGRLRSRGRRCRSPCSW
jgi:hypothetical protein